MSTEKNISITWRDENYGPISGSVAFRAMVLEDISQTAMKEVHKAYKSAGFTLNHNRQSWIAVGKPEAAETLVETLSQMGFTVENRGCVPEELDQPAATAAPSAPRM